MVLCDRKVCAALREGHQGLMKGGKKGVEVRIVAVILQLIVMSVRECE